MVYQKKKKTNKTFGTIKYSLKNCLPLWSVYGRIKRRLFGILNSYLKWIKNWFVSVD